MYLTWLPAGYPQRQGLIINYGLIEELPFMTYLINSAFGWLASFQFITIQQPNRLVHKCHRIKNTP